MPHYRLHILFSALVTSLLSVAQSADAPPFQWQTASPASQGMSEKQLDAMQADLAARKTAAFLVIRNDKIVYEWYADGHSATKPHYTASMAKAIVGGVSCSVAMTDVKIALDDLASKYIPQWQSDPR
jgi:CubicO group peptidase (beta-lactamase class C family)